MAEIQNTSPDEEVLEEELPSEEEAVEPEEHKLVRVRFNGNWYEMPEHLAEVWHQRDELYDKKIRALGDENAKLRTPKPEPKPAPPASSSPDAEIEFWTAPQQYLSSREEQLAQKLREELRQEYQIEQQRQQFWSAFYRDNPDLVGQERLVGYLVQEGYNDLKDLSPDECRRELASRVHEIRGTRPVSATQKKTLPSRQIPTERATRVPSTPSPPPAEPPSPKGFSTRLREIQEAKRKAQFNSPKE